VIGGVVALVALTLHGALWLTIKTSGELAAARAAHCYPLWLQLAALTVDQPRRHHHVRPASLDNYFNYPVTFVVPVGVVASLAGIWLFNRKYQPVKAFLSSCLYMFFMLAGACWGLYPTLLPATTGADRDITLSRAHLRPAHAGCGAGVVELWNDAGHWLRGVCLQQVPRQGGSAAAPALRL
jgi:cytochrome d ubiquinol oxidase subunit II